MKTRSLILDLLIAGRVGALFSVTALLVLLLAACARPQIGIGRTPTPSPAPTSTLGPAPTATSQPTPRPALPTSTSTPVEALPMAIRPETLLLSNVEKDYATNSGWKLEKTVTPGLYLLVFEHDSFIDLVHPRPPSDIPKSVTYRLEIVDSP